MSFITRRIRAWRYGYTGISGLNQMQNNFKMLLIILGPFLVVWYGAQYCVYAELVPRAMGPIVILLSIGGWAMYCLGVWAWITTDANKYKGLPQATVYFPDGGVVKYDFLIEPEGITERCKWDDGSVGLELSFVNRYLYQARDMEFPYVFNKILVRVPAETGKAFKFLSSGEFWHKGMVVETPNCEHVSIYIYGYVKENGEWKPVGAINDCSFTYAKALEKYNGNMAKDVEAHEADVLYMLYHGALQREDELRQYTETLEETLETTYAQQGPKVKKQVDNVLSMVRERVHSITDTSVPIWKRIFNFGFLAKVIIILVVVWAIGHYLIKVW